MSGSTLIKDHMSTRYMEFCVATYFAATGVLFVSAPQTLDAAVYSAWKHLGVRQWGFVMLCVFALHATALIYNGRDRLVSLPARSLGSALHLCICVQFGWFFLQGDAPWGIVLYWGFIPFVVFPVYQRCLAQWFLVYQGKINRHGH